MQPFLLFFYSALSVSIIWVMGNHGGAIHVADKPACRAVFSNFVHHIKRNLSFILRKPAGNNELVIVEPNLVHEVVQNRFTHIWVVQIRVKILVEICLNAVLVFVQRLPDKFGFDCFRQRVFSS